MGSDAAQLPQAPENETGLLALRDVEVVPQVGPREPGSPAIGPHDEERPDVDQRIGVVDGHPGHAGAQVRRDVAAVHRDVGACRGQRAPHPEGTWAGEPHVLDADGADPRRVGQRPVLEPDRDLQQLRPGDPAHCPRLRGERRTAYGVRSFDDDPQALARLGPSEIRSSGWTDAPASEPVPVTSLRSHPCTRSDWTVAWSNRAPRSWQPSISTRSKTVSVKSMPGSRQLRNVTRRSTEKRSDESRAVTSATVASCSDPPDQVTPRSRHRLSSTRSARADTAVSPAMSTSRSVRFDSEDPAGSTTDSMRPSDALRPASSTGSSGSGGHAGRPCRGQRLVRHPHQPLDGAHRTIMSTIPRQPVTAPVRPVSPRRRSARRTRRRRARSSPRRSCPRDAPPTTSRGSAA